MSEIPGDNIIRGQGEYDAPEPPLPPGESRAFTGRRPRQRPGNVPSERLDPLFQAIDDDIARGAAPTPPEPMPNPNPMGIDEDILKAARARNDAYMADASRTPTGELPLMPPGATKLGGAPTSTREFRIPFLGGKDARVRFHPGSRPEPATTAAQEPDNGMSPLRPPDVPPLSPDPLQGVKVVRGPSSRNIPETLRNALSSTFSKETALFVGAVGTGLAARKLEEMTGLSPDVIANIARLMPVIGGLTASISGGGGLLEMRGLQRAANAKSERAEEVWQKNMNTWRRVRRISEFIALASFADKIASAGHAVENAFAHAISNHDTEPTPTPHATSTPHKTETPTPISSPTKEPTHIPTATTTPIPTPTEPHGGLGTNPTPTATSTPDTGPATPTPTHSPTPVPTVIPGVPGSGGIGGGSPTPLEVHGFNIGANAVSAVVELPHITPPHTPDNPIAGPGHPGLDPGITPPTEAPPGTGGEALAHFDFTAHGHHITGNAYDNSYMFDDKHWNLEGNFTDHFVDVPQGMHIDHTALQTALNQFVDGYANDTLEPGSVAYDVGHYANGTSSVYDQIAHNPEFRQHLIDAHILVPDEPAPAVTPDIHPVSPLVAAHGGEDTPPQTTAQVVDKITALHASADNGSDQVDKLATVVAHHQADISTAAPTVPIDTPPGTTSDTTHITPPLGNGGDFPLNAGTETFPADAPVLHTGPIDHVQSPVNGHIVNGQLGNDDNPLTYKETGEDTAKNWDLQNTQKEAAAIAYLQNHGINVDYDQAHKGIGIILEDAAFQQVNNKLDDYSPEGLLFHWFNGTESMEEFFKQNPEALQQAFEKLAVKYPDILPMGIGVAPSELPPNVIPFPGQKISNVVDLPNNTKTAA